jgi:hypothetical protein
MKISNSIIKIVPALLASQKKIEAVEKKADNPFFHSKYADLNSLIDACKSILNANDILVLQPIVDGHVETRLIHISGEWMSSRTRIVSKSENDPQAQGSAITYARRYGLQSMLFMSAEDDDGEKAVAHLPTKIAEKPVSNSKELQVYCEVCKSLMVHKTGTNKDGKEWSGWFCPTNKEHPPRWI